MLYNHIQESPSLSQPQLTTTDKTKLGFVFMKEPDPDLDVGSFGVFCSQDIFVSLVPSPQNDLLYRVSKKTRSFDFGGQYHWL